MNIQIGITNNSAMKKNSAIVNCTKKTSIGKNITSKTTVSINANIL